VDDGKEEGRQPSCVKGEGVDDGKEEGEGERESEGGNEGEGEGEGEGDSEGEGKEGGKNKYLRGSSNPDVKEIHGDAYLPHATYGADMREAQYRFQVGELEEATTRGACRFTIKQLTDRLQIAADIAQVYAEKLRDRQSKFWAQEQGYVDDAKRLAAAKWAQIHARGHELQQARAQGCSQRRTSELKRSIRILTDNAQIMDQKVTDLEYILRSRENSKRRQAQHREVVVQARVDELKQAKVGKLEWWQAEEREQAVPVVTSFPRVETRQMKRARLS